MEKEKTVISSKFKVTPNFRELYQYRDLLFELAFRDIKVRYAQTILGVVWAVLQPLVTLAIFILIFGKGLKVDTGDVPYAIYALVGMSAWSYFSYVMNQSGQSIVGAQDMIKKIYFPRIVIPLSKALVGFVEFFVALALLFALFVYYQVPVSVNIIFLPVFIGINVLAALSVGIWLSALSIRYRDFIHILPFLTQIGLYVSPIAYPVSYIPEQYQLLYFLNPMVGIVEGFRWSILGNEVLPSYALISFGLIIFLFVTGIAYFRRMERVVADLI